MRNFSRFVKLSHLTSSHCDIGFNIEIECESFRFLPRGAARCFGEREFFCRVTHSLSFSNRQNYRVLRPACLFILDNGKPVERPGRKAKGREIPGSLVAERVKAVFR